MAGTLAWRVYEAIGGTFIFLEEIESGSTYALTCGQPRFFAPVFYTDWCSTPGVATYYYTSGSYTVLDGSGNLYSQSTPQVMHKRYGFGINPCTFPPPDGDGGMEFHKVGWSAQCSGSEPPGDAVHSASIQLKHSHTGGTVYDSATGSITVTIPDCCEEPPPPPDEDPFILTTAVGSGTGNPLYDQATLGNLEEPATGTITFDLYGPDDDDCSGSVIFTSEVDVIGNGEYTSEVYFPTEEGVYRWVAAYSGDENNDPLTSACDDPNEQVTVGPGVNPGMSLRTADTGTEIWFRPTDHGQVF